MSKERKPKYEIGQQYWSRGKHPRLCTVVDILRTYNSAGDLLFIRYVATHEFMGQTVINGDVPEAAISMSLIENKGKPCTA